MYNNMENSFFEYRDKTGMDSGSDSEIIDDSIVESVPFSAKKKNRTAFIAESDESSSNDEDNKEDILSNNACKSIARHSSTTVTHVISSSEDDSPDTDSDYSPELVPKRALQKKSIESNKSVILQRTKKRMLFQDSDTDNSIIIERNKNRKLQCLKDTPLKIERKNSVVNESTDDDVDKSDDNEESDDNESNDVDDHDSSKSCQNIDNDEETDNEKSDNSNDETYDSINHKTKTVFSKVRRKLVINSDDSDDEIINKPKKSEELSVSNSKYCSKNTENQITDDEDDGPDEDLMVMSRATRMSIMGIIPKDNDSDESDFIQSDESSRKTIDGITASTEDLTNLELRPDKRAGSRQLSEKLTASNEGLPEVTMHKTTEKDNKILDGDVANISLDSNDSKLTCSPFSSPIRDITNLPLDTNKDSTRKSKVFNTDISKKIDCMDLTGMQDEKTKMLSKIAVIDLCNIESKGGWNKVLDESASVLTRKKQQVANDDVTIIDTKPEIIALSSDDEDEESVQADKKPPVSRKFHENNNNVPTMETIKQYLPPASYPGQVKYVTERQLDEELKTLAMLKDKRNNMQAVLNQMDLNSLPDGGVKVVTSLQELEIETRQQGDKVASMVVDPEKSKAEKDLSNPGLSWDDLQKASNAVKPKMFGKQAMATHMAERNLILESLRDLHASLGSRPAETKMAPQPSLLKTSLMLYQRHALAWLQWRETQKPAAGILADDMGLGKTITMISLVASDKQARLDHDDDSDEGTTRQPLARGGTLVVCPASLIQQWESEVLKHCTPHAISVCLHHGAARTSHTLTLARYDMVATTYNILQRDNDKKGVLMRIQWRRIILDEAHIVRNHKSATSVAVSNLKSKRRWCLSGTPVQNKDIDLFALLKFLKCSPFDDLLMWKKWIDNKSQGGQERLSTIMRCILLRRTKVQLQQKGQLESLPQRSPHMIQVSLTKDEMNVYQKVLVLSKTLFAQFLHQRAEKNSDATSFTAPGKDTEYAKMHKRMIALQGVKPVKSHEILVLLLRLRQVCCHCGLIASMLDEATPGAEPDAASSDLLRELDKLSLEDSNRRKSQNPIEELNDDDNQESAKADEAIRAVLAPNHPVFQLSKPSSKVSAVMDCLAQKVFTDKGDKAVVVSQWTSVLRLVEQELNKRRIRSVTLSGSVPVPARPRLIDQLNDPKSDIKVMLLSLCAGGVGINLCGANHLLLLDPHWNPQLEEQAQDRIYRLGQKKHVHIYRFMCVETVEQTIRKLQEAKLQLAENVLTGARNTAASSLSIDDLKMLFNMGT